MPIKVPATKAVHISEYYPERNPIPGDPTLFISRFKGVGDVFRSLINFNLQNLDSLFPPGTVVGCAFLQLMVTRNDLPSGTISASLWRCLNDWNVTDVTWNTQPETAESPDLTFTISSGWTGMMAVDVTTLVQDWLGGHYQNYGFQLRGDELNDRVVAFSPEVSLVIVPSRERITGGQVIGETVFMDYPLRPEPRYGYGKPSHPGVSQLLKNSRSTYLRNLEHVLGLRSLFREIPEVGDESSINPHWQNQWISGFDAVSLCSILAKYNPRRYVEVGSGESTRFARWTINRLHLQTGITSIDPAPRSDIYSLCDQVIRDRVENVSINLFSELKSGDILFIDSSHRALMNSDVTAIFLDILPHLQSGVVVHFHDIFLPDDYPPQWIGRYYSEQYLLATCLLAGGSGVKILQPNYYISRDPQLSKVLDPLWADLPHLTRHGASFWIMMG